MPTIGTYSMPVPAGSAVPDVPSAFQDLANRITLTGVSVGQAANKAAIDLIDSPVAGMVVLAQDTGVQWRHDGSAWKAWSSGWIAWTPTLTAGSGSFSVGDGTLTARYRYVGGVVHYKFRLVLGSSSSVGTNSAFTLPVTAESSIPAWSVVARGTLATTTGSSLFEGIAYLSGASTTVAIIGTWNVASTYPTYSGVAATIPFTWASGAYIDLEGWYVAA